MTTATATATARLGHLLQGCPDEVVASSLARAKYVAIPGDVVAEDNDAGQIGRLAMEARTVNAHLRAAWISAGQPPVDEYDDGVLSPREEEYMAAEIAAVERDLTRAGLDVASIYATPLSGEGVMFDASDADLTL